MTSEELFKAYRDAGESHKSARTGRRGATPMDQYRTAWTCCIIATCVVVLNQRIYISGHKPTIIEISDCEGA